MMKTSIKHSLFKTRVINGLYLYDLREEQSAAHFFPAEICNISSLKSMLSVPIISHPSQMCIGQCANPVRIFLKAYNKGPLFSFQLCLTEIFPSQRSLTYVKGFLARPKEMLKGWEKFPPIKSMLTSICIFILKTGHSQVEEGERQAWILPKPSQHTRPPPFHNAL